MSRKARILYWTPRFWPDIGGIEVLAMRTLPALQERNYEFAVITSHGDRRVPDEMDHHGTPVHRFRFWTTLSEQNPARVLKLQRQIAQLKERYQPDLVHLHFPGHIAYFHLNTLSASPSPTLLTLHSDFSSYRGDPDTLFGQTLRSATWVNAVSRATLADAIHIVPEIVERSSVIYNGLTPPELSPAPLDFDTPRILYLGRLVAEKGVDLAITAFASLRRRFPRARMTIAGNGPVRPQLEKLVRELEATGAVEFAGWIDPEKVPELINGATIVVIPSRHREPFALVALQAAQMARPVVAARMGGLPETVVDQQTGILFENEDSAALADAIAFLLDHPDAAARMGDAGRRRARETFTLEKCVDAYDSLYARLIQKRGKDSEN
jgi:glycogen(starch) synthase